MTLDLSQKEGRF